MNYIPLQPGDVRKCGDEMKTKHPHQRHYKEYNQTFDWTPIGPGLIDHPILPSDTVNTEFRRPV